jgi:hypothetical protein
MHLHRWITSIAMDQYVKTLPLYCMNMRSIGAYSSTPFPITAEEEMSVRQAAVLGDGLGSDYAPHLLKVPYIEWNIFVSCLVFSCLVLSCLALPCLVLSCLVLSCLVLSCLVLSCLILSCLVLPCLVLSCLVLSYLVSSCLVLSRLVLFCLVSSCLFTCKTSDFGSASASELLRLWDAYDSGC